MCSAVVGLPDAAGAAATDGATEGDGRRRKARLQPVRGTQRRSSRQARVVGEVRNNTGVQYFDERGAVGGLHRAAAVEE